MSDSQICYYRARVQLKGQALAIGGVRESLCIAHFYVQTEDVSTCGAVGAQFCVSHSVEHVEFLSLPQPIARVQIDSHEVEHLHAYELALREGVTVVIGVAGVVAS